MERNAHQHELTPVMYGGLPVNLLHIRSLPGQLSPSLHWHDRFEMLVMDEGTLHLTVVGEHFTARAGDVVVINPGFTHKGIAGEEGAAYRVLAFELIDQFAADRTAAAVLQPVLEGAAAFSSLVRGDTVLLGLVEDICRECEQQPAGCEMRLLGLTYLLLARLCECHLVSRHLQPLTGQRFRHVVAYLADHFCEDISVADLSARFGYEPSYFCRLFRQSTGLRTTEYIRILRLEKARRMLKNGQDSIAHVAASCGFADANYFARCFKAHYGLTAGDYRQKNSSKPDR